MKRQRKDLLFQNKYEEEEEEEKEEEQVCCLFILCHSLPIWSTNSVSAIKNQESRNENRK